MMKSTTDSLEDAIPSASQIDSLTQEIDALVQANWIATDNLAELNSQILIVEVRISKRVARIGELRQQLSQMKQLSIGTGRTRVEK